MCNFVVVEVTKLDSNNKHNNNNKKITLHSCTDQLKNSYILNNSTHSPALQCITYTGSSYHSWPPDASTRGVHLTVHCLLNCIPQHVKMTLCDTALDHQMPLVGVHLTVHCLLNSIPHSSACQDDLT